MGEIIKKIEKIRIGNSSFWVEKNKGTHSEGIYDIHIQNDRFRLNITEDDFIKMSACILYARENLMTYKVNGVRQNNE